MEIVTKQTAVLIPYVNNARTHSTEQIKQIAASIKEFGFTNPILLDGDNGIIAGHGRVMAAELLKMAEVPCIELPHLTPAQKKAYILADNKLALNAGWDDELLEAELKSLEELDFDVDLTGFDSDELSDIFRDGEAVEDDFDVDAEIEAIETPVSKLGDIWQLGNHRLMCGDSTDKETVAKLMDGNKADMVFTDPPYGIDYSGGRTQTVKNKQYGKILSDTLVGDNLGNLICNVFIFNKSEADIYICVSPIMQKPFMVEIERCGKVIDAVIVWDKKIPGLGYMAYRRQCEFILFVKGSQFKKGDKSDFDLWQISRDNANKYVHGTQKPIAVPSRAICNSSKQENIILDLFGGSGSTLIACEQTNRNCYMMELDEKYCDVIIKRWETLTGKQAEVIHSGTKQKTEEVL